MWVRGDDSPYYVGKGKGKRAFDESRKTHPKSTARVRIVKSGLSEDAAFKLEKELISKYGRKNLGTGILINRTDGGDGASGHILNDTQKANVRKAAQKRTTEEYCRKMSDAKIRTMTPELKLQIKKSLTGKPKAVEHRLALRKAWETRTGFGPCSSSHKDALRVAITTYWQPIKRTTCPYCGKTIVERFYKKFHGDNCKEKA